MKNKIDRVEIPIDLDSDKFILRREEDGKIIKGTKVGYIEWDENGHGKAMHTEPAVGRSIVVDLYGPGDFEWMTTQITEILPNNTFKTKNSTYTIYEL